MNRKRRSGLAIMGRLILLIRPLLGIMVLAVLLGTAGYLCAISLTILAGYGLAEGLGSDGFLEAFPELFFSEGFMGIPVRMIFLLLIVLAVLRGVLHYAEQYCNHFIAFRLLAIIRHQVFAALRKLAPAKLEGRDKGNLISIITSDIELLEVFYAHTISPIAIAVCTSAVLVFYIGGFHWSCRVLALLAYGVVGVLLPLWNGRRGAQKGMAFRDDFGDLNSFVLDSLRGVSETIQYGCGQAQREELASRSQALCKKQEGLHRLERSSRALTNLAILFFSFAMLFLTLYLYQNGTIGFEGVLLGTMAMSGSFGPVAALASLSNNLHQTLASGERVLSILEEQPAVEEVAGAAPTDFAGAGCSHVDFSYEEEQILQDYSIRIPKGEIVGIHGKSGSGKSTLLKLLMRFWDVQAGNVTISDREIRQINTADLRDMESFVTQETWLFHDTIANNIAVGRPGASREDIAEAAKKAAIHDMISGLPKGYDTPVGELGDTLSGGERQRIGIARAFLHDAPFMLLDEPTSNLDALNEGIILKSLKDSCDTKTVVLVSHRDSTMKIADTVYEMENGRLS